MTGGIVAISGLYEVYLLLPLSTCNAAENEAGEPGEAPSSFVSAEQFKNLDKIGNEVCVMFQFWQGLPSRKWAWRGGFVLGNGRDAGVHEGQLALERAKAYPTGLP